MQITITRRMAVTVVAVLALVAAGGAVAASKGSGAAPQGTGCQGRPAGARGAEFANAVAAYLGITKAELAAARDGGTPLAELATQKGKTVAGLKDAIYADARAHLDADVAAGKLTSAQESSMLASLRSHLDDIVHATGPPPLGPPPAA
jgi:hypothetical protein